MEAVGAFSLFLAQLLLKARSYLKEQALVLHVPACMVVPNRIFEFQQLEYQSLISFFT